MKRFYRSITVFVLIAAVLVSQLGQIAAQSNALAITPRKDYTLKPGESVTDTLAVTNQDTTRPLILDINLVNFTSTDETGTPQLLREEGAATTPWSINDFVTLPEQVSVAPGETVNIPINIEIPDDTGAGSYYSAIEYASIADEEENRVNIAASGVTLVFVKVPGIAKQQLTFERFGAFVPDVNGTGGSYAGLFFSNRPKVMAYTLTNNGNVAEQPNASIVIKNFSGKEVYTIANANLKNQLALRDQTRRFDACIVPETTKQNAPTGVEIETVVCGDTNFAPGRYTAELSVLYGENGNETREVTAQASFWYLPWWFLGIMIVVIAFVAGAITLVVRRVKDVGSRKTRKRRF